MLEQSGVKEEEEKKAGEDSQRLGTKLFSLAYGKQYRRSRGKGKHVLGEKNLPEKTKKERKKMISACML